MAKERIILAFVAILAGLIFASTGFYFYQRKNPQTNVGTESLITPSSSPSPTNNSAILEIESPEDGSITDKKTAEIKGKSLPGTLIALSTNIDDFVFKASDDGKFSKKIDLSEDENIITVTAYADSGASDTKELTITYTEEEF